jgi:hypothetical protein
MKIPSLLASRLNGLRRLLWSAVLLPSQGYRQGIVASQISILEVAEFALNRSRLSGSQCLKWVRICRATSPEARQHYP